MADNGKAMNEEGSDEQAADDNNDLDKGVVPEEGTDTSPLIWTVHDDCHFAFERLIEALQNPVRDYRGQLPVHEVQEEFDKYKIWAGNVGAGHFGKRHEISLDYRLREAKFLKDQVGVH